MLFSASWLYEELKCHHWQMLHFWPPKGSVYRSAFNEHSYWREQTRAAHKSIHEQNPFWQKWMNFCQHPVFSPELTRLSRQISLALFYFVLSSVYLFQKLRYGWYYNYMFQFHFSNLMIILIIFKDSNLKESLATFASNFWYFHGNYESEAELIFLLSLTSTKLNKTRAGAYSSK